MADAIQYVTLAADGEVFAIPVALVQEILDMRPVTRLPGAPASLLGLIDVRGHSVPVIDLRAKLSRCAAPATPSTRILVIELPSAGRLLRLGLLADRVFEVTGLDQGALEPPPEFGQDWRPDCIQGVGRRHGGFVIVLDIARLIAGEAPALAAVQQPGLAA